MSCDDGSSRSMTFDVPPKRVMSSCSVRIAAFVLSQRAFAVAARAAEMASMARICAWFFCLPFQFSCAKRTRYAASSYSVLA